METALKVEYFIPLEDFKALLSDIYIFCNSCNSFYYFFDDCDCLTYIVLFQFVDSVLVWVWMFLILVS